VRRRCILGMGCIMAIFGVSTSAWGLVFKNTVSDVGATVYAMIKYRDPPFRAERIRQHQSGWRDGGYRERLRHIDAFRRELATRFL